MNARELAQTILAYSDEVIPEPDNTMDSWREHDEALADRYEVVYELAVELARLVTSATRDSS